MGNQCTKLANGISNVVNNNEDNNKENMDKENMDKGDVGASDVKVEVGADNADNIDLGLINADNSVGVFTLEGQVLPCKVVNVYDGDTCKIVIRMNNKLVKFNCRMNGYDTPEMRPPKNKYGRDEEIRLAKLAKARLIELIMNDKQIVYVKCGEFDKYGRLLTDIYLTGDEANGVDSTANMSVNQMMINEGHGYEYHGGTKRT